MSVTGQASTSNRESRLRAAAIVATLVSTFLVGFGAQPAFAGVADSAFGYFTAGSTQYANRATILTSSLNAQARTTTYRNSGSTPAGWAGSRGRLFTSGGALSCEGTTIYNPALYPAHGFSCTRLSSGAWYSWGVSQGWNGSGYNTFYTYKSPNQNS